MVTSTIPLSPFSLFFFFNDTATTEIYTLSLHDALPIFAPPAYPDVADLVAARGIDQLRNHVVHRLRLDLVEAYRGEVGLLAGFDRADAVVPAHRLRAAERRGVQGGGGVERARVVRDRLAQQGGGAHLAEHVEVIVAGAAVGAEREADARLQQPGCRAEARGELE